MSHELETAGALSVGGFFRRNKVEMLAVGTPCANCATPLKGPWCHACGQLGEDFHRSAAKLLLESLRELIDVDNRIWRTLPDLVIRPGRLTRAYLDGRRAPQVPPLRLFLVVLVLLFLIGLSRSPAIIPASPIPTGPAERAAAIQRLENDKRLSLEDRKDIVAEIRKGDLKFGAEKSPMVTWLVTRINYALAHQPQFWQAIQNWAERFAILMLPLSTVLLSLLFAFRKSVFLFDHIIFSLHSLSFMCVLLLATILTNRYTPVQIGGIPFLAASLHLFAHMRGVYGTSIMGTLFRMSFLFVGTVIGFTFILIGLIWVALNAMS